MSKAIEFKQHTYTPNEFYDYLAQFEKAMSADLVLACSPATLGSSAAAIAAKVADEEKYEVEVTVTLKDTAGNLHEWFNKDLAVAVVADTVGDGTAAIKGGAETVEIRKGIGKITVEYDGTWAADDTSTLTVTGGTFVGVATGNKTSVDTIVA